jgi:hypothetical protein
LRKDDLDPNNSLVRVFLREGLLEGLLWSSSSPLLLLLLFVKTMAPSTHSPTARSSI